MLRPPTSQTAASLFAHYELDASFDEMFAPGHAPRDAYRAAVRPPARAARPTEWRQRQQAADRAFLNQGITFTVYGDDEGTERIFPYDLLPRIITGAEWEHRRARLAQRLRALNLFLQDIYHEGRILAEGDRPARAGLQLPALPPRDARRARAARHLRPRRRHRPGPRRGRRLRRARGQPARAERRLLHARQPAGDEARLPAACSRATASARSITTARQLLAHAAGAGAARPTDPTIVAAHAGRLQLGLLRAHLPRPADGRRAGRGPRPRSCTTTSSTCGRPAGRGASTSSTAASTTTSSIRWPSGATRSSAWPAWSTPTAPATSSLANAVGTGVADDKAIYAYVPAIIQYYLQRGPDPAERRDLPAARRRRSASTSSSNLDELVVKAVGESGGYGMLIGPHSTEAEREEFRAPHRGQPAQLHRPADAGAVARALLRRRRRRGPARRPAAVRPVQRPGDHRCPAG